VLFADDAGTVAHGARTIATIAIDVCR
jgi:hypothetical protein